MTTTLTEILSKISTVMLLDLDAEIGVELDGIIEEWYADNPPESVPDRQAFRLLADRVSINKELRSRNVPLELIAS